MDAIKVGKIWCFHPALIAIAIILQLAVAEMLSICVQALFIFFDFLFFWIFSSIKLILVKNPKFVENQNCEIKIRQKP